MVRKARGYVDCAYLPGGHDCNNQIGKEKCPSATRGAIVCLTNGVKAGANRARACTTIIKTMCDGKYQKKAVA